MISIKKYLVGTDEPYPETIRHFLHSNWPTGTGAPAAPKVISPYGTDSDEAAKARQLTSNDFELSLKAADASPVIRIYQGNTVRDDPQIWTLSSARLNTTIYIDIFLQYAWDFSPVQDAIDKIILDHMPNTSVRVSKSDGTDSGIATFDRQSLEWTNVKATPDTKALYQWSAELGVIHVTE